MKNNTKQNKPTNGTEKISAKVSLNLPVQTELQTVRQILDLLGLADAPMPPLESIDEFHLILSVEKGGK
jgi:hypothetical protein